MWFDVENEFVTQKKQIEQSPTPAKGTPSSLGVASDSLAYGSPLESSSPETPAETASPTTETADMNGEKNIEMLQQLPPEIGTLLVMSGIAGMLLPGPVGFPLLIAGGVTLWPRTFQPMERWLSRRFPGAHREGVIQIKDFVGILQNRFPDGEQVD